MPVNFQRYRSQRGFNLTELVIGIVVLAVALIMMLTLIFPQASRSLDPFHQVRASELAHSLLNEILSKKFDHCSAHTGDSRSDLDCSNNPVGSFRCDEAGITGLVIPCIASIPACPASGLTVATEEGIANRARFNDVDDYHCLDQSGDEIENALGEALTNFYHNYRVQVAVAYDGAALGLTNRAAKRVTVTVTLPSGERISFSGYRGNY